ncbi:MAG: zinc ABC transporter substrate-binding protein [Cypionkella sp.]|nr:zinc ABC transporter substrate-binding protein [Cypionkella sp.]
MLNRRHFMGLLAGATVAQPLWASASPAIVATTAMVADAARQISGLPVTALMGPGLDPHSHRPTRADIQALSRADLVLWHGLNLEAQFNDLMADLAARGSVVAVGEAVDRARLLSDPAYPDSPDPHIWFDAGLWAEATRAVEAAVLPHVPDAAARAEAFRAEILAMGDYAAGVLASVPEEARVLVTAHDAFAYFGRAYGFEVEGVQGISTESEAGLQRIAELVDLLVARRIPAVFVESSVSDRSVRALIEGAAAKGHQVTIGGELFSDAMGPEGSYEGTWVGMFDHNATVIARALGGTAPERGASGRLGLAG